MIERSPKKGELQVVSQEHVKTPLGEIIKSEVVFEGKPRTVYAPSNPTQIAFINDIRDIVSAEKFAADPIVLSRLEAEGTTPEQIIEDGSSQFIEDLRTNTYTPKINETVLAPLIKQKAMAGLFDEAQKVQEEQSQ